MVDFYQNSIDSAPIVSKIYVLHFTRRVILKYVAGFGVLMAQVGSLVSQFFSRKKWLKDKGRKNLLNLAQWFVMFIQALVSLSYSYDFYVALSCQECLIFE